MSKDQLAALAVRGTAASTGKTERSSVWSTGLPPSPPLGSAQRSRKPSQRNADASPKKYDNQRVPAQAIAA
jgi:hypothetical protein